MKRKIINLSQIGTYSNTLIEEDSRLNERKFNNYDQEPFTLEDIDIPSEIIDKLIRLTAKWTNRFASDLLVDIDSLRRNFAKLLNDEKYSNYLVYYFGFRKDGIDHKEFIEIQSYLEYRTRYIEVWKLEIYGDPFKPEVNWKLVQIENYINEADMIEVDN